MSELTRELGELASQWLIKPSVVQFPDAAVRMLCQANPLRWALRIGFSADFGGVFAVAPGPNFNPGVGHALVFPNRLELNYRADAGLVQVAWYCLPNGVPPASMYVIETLAVQ